MMQKEQRQSRRMNRGAAEKRRTKNNVLTLLEVLIVVGSMGLVAAMIGLPLLLGLLFVLRRRRVARQSAGKNT